MIVLNNVIRDLYSSSLRRSVIGRGGGMGCSYFKSKGIASGLIRQVELFARKIPDTRAHDTTFNSDPNDAFAK